MKYIYGLNKSGQSIINYFVKNNISFLAWDDDALIRTFINNNYPRFLQEIVPCFNERDIIFVVNEAANLENLPFTIKKDFRIGSNGDGPSKKCVWRKAKATSHQ